MSISPREDEHNPAGQAEKYHKNVADKEFALAYDYSEVEASNEEARKLDPNGTDNIPVWRNRYFMYLWIAQALSQTAQHTLNISLIVYVGKLTKDSPTQTSIVTACFLLPGVFFSAIAGVFVDWFRKRTTLLVTNITRALLVPWLFFMTALPLGLALPIIYLITIIFSTISQFFNPAEAAAIPLLVKPHQLTKANSLFQITLFATLFLGTSLLGPLLPDLIGPDKVFLVIGILYFICIWLVWALPKSEQVHKRPGDKTIWQTIKDIFLGVYEAWQFIRKDTQIWLAIVYLSTVQTALFTMTAIGIPFVGEKGLKQSSNSIIFVLAPLSIGLGVAVVLVNRVVTPANRLTALKYACGALGIILALVGLVKPIADLWVLITAPGVPLGGPGLILLLVSLSIPFGFAIGLLNIPALTILQERSPKELVGRVFAAYFTFANAVSIIPILFAGALGDIFGAVLGVGNGIVPVFFLFGACVVLVAFYGHRRAKV
ncbi:MAG: MFS transporter [Chloroflexi bacterium]|uniref:MFS transporter n=1 Tax=Candidatus Chlorohelix allophototropha TaxID=3003348 RepID=A0A8T7M375_9CHLR|nr:MFS transporter [Chloroflexota bacterium]WJW65505.1 MFS transporter [Chloroflexota bacterium L227-S17]